MAVEPIMVILNLAAFANENAQLMTVSVETVSTAQVRTNQNVLISIKTTLPFNKDKGFLTGIEK